MSLDAPSSRRVSDPDRLLAEAASEPTLDLGSLEELRTGPPGGPDDIVLELSEIFLSDTPRRVSELRAAGEQGEGSRITAIAHAIKGSAATFGARRLARYAEVVECLAARERLAESVAGIARVEAEFRRVAARVSEQVLAPAGSPLAGMHRG